MKKYFIFFVCVASLVFGLSFVVLYFTETSFDYYTKNYEYTFDDENIVLAAIGLSLFLFTAFYLWKNNFFHRNK